MWASSSPRDRVAILLALATAVCLGAAFFVSKGTLILMPGPLTSAHGAIETCSACHTKSGTGKLSWLHGLVAGDPLADSKACLTCHKMPDTAFNAHGAAKDVLKKSTERLAKIASTTPVPQSARAQNMAFPTHAVMERDLYCATCHQEHQGTNFNLHKISNEQCRSCHVVKFDSFDGHHPKFESYPFKRRTRIVYDHAGHFAKHFPEVAKKHPAKRIPDTCSACHNSRDDKRVMAVAPFDQTCTGCHLDQIVGKERATGPKGIAFLSLPALDLQTLKKKNASIGEWPDASEAALTPFMKVMIGRDERGRALIKALDGLNLDDLADATDDQIKAVTALAWEIKKLFHALIAGKASDVLGNLNIGGTAKLSADLVAALTASIPRDVVIGAQQQWLPNLAAEMARRQSARNEDDGVWSTITTETKLSAKVPLEEVLDALERQTSSKLGPQSARHERKLDKSETAQTRAEADKEIVVAEDSTGPITGRRLLPSGTPRSIEALGKDTEKPAQSDSAKSKDEPAKAKPEGDETPSSDKAQSNAGASDDSDKKAEPESTSTQNAAPPGNATEQTDDLLFPTEAELKGMKGGPQPESASGKPETENRKSDSASTEAVAKPDAPARTDTSVESNAPAGDGPKTKATPVLSIESDVDPESWAEYGGWYRQDYTIFYRPTGHKDKFIYSWLFLTGPQAAKGDTSPSAAVFDVLTGKDAQGSCTKCHSIDDLDGKGRMVNFSPPSVESKKGLFTTFIHEPHFGIMEKRGCLTCHELAKDSPYLKSYEQGNPQSFASNFGTVSKDLCQTCHTASMARQDCLLCHNYHVNGVVTPIMRTKLPSQ